MYLYTVQSHLFTLTRGNQTIGENQMYAKLSRKMLVLLTVAILLFSQACLLDVIIGEVEKQVDNTCETGCYNVLTP